MSGFGIRAGIKPRLIIRLSAFLFSLLALGSLISVIYAQELDTTFRTDTKLWQQPSPKPSPTGKKTVGAPYTSTSKNHELSPDSAQSKDAPFAFAGMVKPLTATVSKTLYLPPAMYGQWSITGTVKQTNMDGLVPVAVDIWVLQRDGEQVIVSNPANGASAAVNVDMVQGNTATFHRYGQAGRVVRSETVTLTVQGDQLFGRNLRKEEVFKNGKLLRSYYALFDLQGARISGASAQFRPEALDNGPDIEIEEVQRVP